MIPPTGGYSLRDSMKTLVGGCYSFEETMNRTWWITKVDVPVQGNAVVQGLWR